MSRRQSLVVCAWLVALGYLGLYMYGLFMGAFSPGELVGFTLLAAAVIVAYLVHVVRYKRDVAHYGPSRDRAATELRRQRETRGF